MDAETDRFGSQLEDLGCTPIEVRHLVRLVARFYLQYEWVGQEAMAAEVLDSVRRGFIKFEEARGRRTTYLMRCGRNALISLTRRKMEVRRRARTIQANEDWSIYDNRGPEDLEEILAVLGRVLSPLAYRLVRIAVSEHPKRLGTASMARRLGTTTYTVRALRAEVRRTVPAVLSAMGTE